MYEDLTFQQIETLEFIKTFLDRRGYSPSIKEISNSLDIKSTSSVHKILSFLEEKKYILREQGKNRSIRINTEKDENDLDFQVTSLPLLGVISAGKPILAIENVEEYIPIPNQWLGVGEYFMLRVSGDSMIDAGIFDRDYLIVQKTQAARNGEIIVALIDGTETTVKRIYKEPDGRMRLQPENALYEAIYPEHLKILGRVKKSIRNFF